MSKYSLIRRLLPKSFYGMISTHRTLKRSHERDRVLNHDHPATLQDVHLRHTEILPSRDDLLRRCPQGGVCVEVGVAEADFSRKILDIMQPQKLFLIDLWSPDSERYSKSMELALKNVQSEIDSGVVEIKRGWSWEMLETLEDHSIDWIYIDASHEYDSVRRDLEVTRRKIKKSGLIAGHDYTRWSSQGINRWGVVEAVNEFCIDQHWGFRFLTHETHRHISFAIQKLDF